MKYLSLFSGIGGFELGIQQAYEENLKRKHISEKSKQKERPQGRVRTTNKRGEMFRASDGSAPLCVGFSEIDKYAIQIYEKHFPGHKNWGDITTINPAELPDFDFICGGFPCQAFSIAGKRKGFNDTRGTLFFDIARIIKEKRPRYLLLENVKGLLSHDQGRTFKIILSTLDELGYDIQWQVLNSKNFGVPQNRERVFIIGHIRGEPRPKVFPIGEDDKELNSKIRIIGHSGSGGQKGYIHDSKGLVGALSATDYKQPKQILAQDRKSFIMRGRPKYENGKRGLKWYKYEDNCPTVSTNVAQGDQKNIVNAIRRLTPTECARLQGFPDGWTEGVSDSQRYKCLGNAVTVNVIREIIKKLST